jgi:hypothetical protein
MLSHIGTVLFLDKPTLGMRPDGLKLGKAVTLVML